MRFKSTSMVKRNLKILISSALLFSSIIPTLTGGVRAVSAETAGISAVQEAAALSSFTAPLNEKIMAKSLSQGTVELELAGTLPLDAGYTVEQIVNGQTVMKSLSNVMIGAGNVTVYPK